jgi:hypothetical protein
MAVKIARLSPCRFLHKLPAWGWSLKRLWGFHKKFSSTLEGWRALSTSNLGARYTESEKKSSPFRGL